jgi:transposase
MKEISPDLKARIVAAYHEPTSSIRSVARQFNVAKNTVQKYVKSAATTDRSMDNPAQKRGRTGVLDAYHKQLKQILTDSPNGTLRERCAELEKRTGVVVSVSTMSRILDRIDRQQRKTKRSKPIRKNVPKNMQK